MSSRLGICRMTNGECRVSKGCYMLVALAEDLAELLNVELVSGSEGVVFELQQAFRAREQNAFLVGGLLAGQWSQVLIGRSAHQRENVDVTFASDTNAAFLQRIISRLQLGRSTLATFGQRTDLSIQDRRRHPTNRAFAPPASERSRRFVPWRLRRVL